MVFIAVFKMPKQTSIEHRNVLMESFNLFVLAFVIAWTATKYLALLGLLAGVLMNDLVNDMLHTTMRKKSHNHTDDSNESISAGDT